MDLIGSSWELEHMSHLCTSLHSILLENLKAMGIELQHDVEIKWQGGLLPCLSLSKALTLRDSHITKAFYTRPQGIPLSRANTIQGLPRSKAWCQSVISGGLELCDFWWLGAPIRWGHQIVSYRHLNYTGQSWSLAGDFSIFNKKTNWPHEMKQAKRFLKSCSSPGCAKVCFNWQY